MKYLYEYWILVGLEEILPYIKASDEEKKNLANTLGFQKYVLWAEIQEVKKTIYSILPRFIQRLLGENPKKKQ